MRETIQDLVDTKNEFAKYCVELIAAQLNYTFFTRQCAMRAARGRANNFAARTCSNRRNFSYGLLESVIAIVQITRSGSETALSKSANTCEQMLGYRQRNAANRASKKQVVLPV